MYNLYIKRRKDKYCEKLPNVIRFEADDTVLNITLSDFKYSLGDYIFAINSDIGGLVVDIKKNLRNNEIIVQARNLLCYLRESVMGYYYNNGPLKLKDWFKVFIEELNYDRSINFEGDFSSIPDMEVKIDYDLKNMRNNTELTCFEYVERQLYDKGYIFRLEYRPDKIIIKIRKGIEITKFTKINLNYFFIPKIIIIANIFLSENIETDNNPRQLKLMYIFNQKSLESSKETSPSDPSIWIGAYTILKHYHFIKNFLIFQKYFDYKDENEMKEKDRERLEKLKNFAKEKFEQHQNQFKERKSSFKNMPTVLGKSNKFIGGIADVNEIEGKENLYRGDRVIFFDGENRVSSEIKNKYITYDRKEGFKTRLIFNNN